MNDQPYRPPSADITPLPRTARSLPRLSILFVVALVLYYLLSSVTLPFANRFWLGEIPPLALIQIPKSWLHHEIQAGLIWLLHVLEMNSGSTSPDMIRTQPWAMTMMCMLPPATVLLAARCLRWRCPRYQLAILIVLAACDAAVTFWFERTSSLSLF